MLDEKDLQAIQTIIREEVSHAEQHIAKNTVTLMDAEFSSRFDALADGQQGILDRLDRMEDRLEDMDVVDTRLTALEAMVKKLNREIAALKRAN